VNTPGEPLDRQTYHLSKSSHAAVTFQVFTGQTDDRIQIVQLKCKIMKRSYLNSVLTVFLSLLLFSFTFESNSKSFNNEPVRESDTASVEETRFKVRYDEEKGLVTISVEGELDTLSSVSVTNNRGSEYRFSFVESGASNIEFNVSDLRPGSYYVVLNTGEEIRMKRFLKQK
jgi:YbbR domain-containing protein